MNNSDYIGLLILLLALEKARKDYPGKTIENILVQIRARLDEFERQNKLNNGRNTVRSTVANKLKGVAQDSKSSNRRFLRSEVNLFALYMKMDFDHFVGDTYEEDENAHRPTMPVETACFGDYYFNIQDIRTVVENINYWYERYGSFGAVRWEVIDWYDHTTDPKTKNKINLFHWLSGCPRPKKGGDDGSD